MFILIWIKQNFCFKLNNIPPRRPQNYLFFVFMGVRAQNDLKEAKLLPENQIDKI